MSTRNCTFGNEYEKSFQLEESESLFILRLKTDVGYKVVFNEIPQIKEFRDKFDLYASFPESYAFVFNCKGKDGNGIREEIKKIINEKKHPAVDYVGTVLQFSSTGIYQIYTGNLFIKLLDDLSESKINLIKSKYDLSNRIPLHFAKNAFFLKGKDELGRDIFDLSQEIIRLPEVEYCHPEMVVESRSTVDSFKTNSFSSETINEWILDKTGVKKAWKTTQGEGVKICIIDDGLDFEHPAFSGNGKIFKSKDMHANGINRLPLHQYKERHGTACASIALSSDPLAYGVAPKAQLIPIRATALGSVLQSEAFYWAVENEADIISCSWGPPDGSLFDSKAEAKEYPIPAHTNLAIKYASENGRNGKGCPIFFAAGNGREAVNKDGYASHPNVMAIGSTNKIDQATQYSDFGTPLSCCFPSGEIELKNNRTSEILYGVRVADITGKKGYSLDNYYDLFEGTSASCPGAAGVAALILSANQSLNQQEVKNIIEKSCQKIGNVSDYVNGYSQKFGHGLLKADLAVNNSLIFKNKKTMKAYSLHVGINKVDGDYYRGYVPELSGCVNDMNNMKNLAQSLKYETSTLADSAATKEKIIAEITRLGNLVEKDGILLITYSGHGAPIREASDEATGKDQAWVTYNGFLVDDLLNETFSKFDKEFRILLVSDSCFSGSMLRAVNLDSKFPDFRRTRGLTKSGVDEILKINNETIDKLVKKGAKPTPKASVKLLSACTDNEPALESDSEGLFTKALLKIYNSNKASLNYREFVDLIIAEIGSAQNPQIEVSGKNDENFDNSKPFAFELSNTHGTSTSGNVEMDPKVKPQLPKKPQNSRLIVFGDAKYVNTSSKGKREIGSNNEVKVSNGTILSENVDGKTEWDKAYNLFLGNLETGKVNFVEPDMASNLFHSETESIKEDNRSVSEYLNTYPNPETEGNPEPFIWHLDNEHSQLKRAREHVFPELNLGTSPQNLNDLVKIAHIDTGYIPNHAALPENLDTSQSVHYFLGQQYEGAGDNDICIYPNETQGHGNATMAILAGGKIDNSVTNGQFSGYFGGVPFARVLSLKVSETVVLLAGRNFAQAVDFAIEQKCDVITMSMAGLPSKKMAEAVNRAYEAGIFIVSAAGNSWVKGVVQQILPKVTMYPARYDRVIAATGATYKDEPYLYDLNNPQTRDAGGLFMQTCYGPTEALPTTMAAYTPNLTWFNGEGDKPAFVKTGGGTSSATPQIAAAAALYIQKYKNELEEIAENEPWKKVEIVRQALFKTAKKTPYTNVFGNGIVQAYNALLLSPISLVNEISKSTEAKPSGGLFGGFFKLLFNRSISFDAPNNKNEILQEMLGLELSQLMHRDKNLTKYLSEIDIEGNLPANYKNKINFINDVKKSDKASAFLLQNLISTDNPTSYGSNRNVQNDDSKYYNFNLKSKKGEVSVRSEGIKCKMLSKKLDQKVENVQNVWFDEFQLEIEVLPTRGDTNEQLGISHNYEAEGLQSAMLLEYEFEGKTYYEWSFENTDTKSASSRSRGIVYDSYENNYNIPLSFNANGQSRGIFNKLGKVFVKLFKWLKPTITVNKTDIFESLGDSKYKLLAYDLNQNGAGEWVDITKGIQSKIEKDSKPILILFPGLFSTVEKGYDEFLENQQVIDDLKSKYCSYLLGYNMPTLIHGIEKNAEELLEKLKENKFENKKIAAMARSRGGIVARYAKEKLNVNFEKILFVGTPNQGTRIASSDNWSKLLNIATNVANLAFGSIVPVLPKITSILKAMANEVVELPGINDLEEDGEFIKTLNSVAVNTENYFSVVSNYDPDAWFKKILNKIAVDQFIFNSQPNDSIVPTAGAVFKNAEFPTNITLNPDNYLLVGTTEGVNHFAYLKPENDDIIKWILNKL